MQGHSILIGGGQKYYGATADRDRKVVSRVAELLCEHKDAHRFQIITGGTAGIPDDFAAIANLYMRVLDIVSSEYLGKKTKGCV